jgi:hypothetical protein
MIGKRWKKSDPSLVQLIGQDLKVASMKVLSRLRGLIILAAVICVLGSFPFSAARPAEGGIGHSSNLVAKITMPDGDTRTVIVQGVGCAVNMCSRVAVRSKEEADTRLATLGLHRETRTWLDSIAAIKDITNNDALFVLKDGCERRLSIVDGNRFFYFGDRYFGSGKIDVAKVRSIEFVSTTSR